MYKIVSNLGFRALPIVALVATGIAVLPTGAAHAEAAQASARKNSGAIVAPTRARRDANTFQYRSLQDVPEPGALALLIAAGITGIGAARSMRRIKSGEPEESPLLDDPYK